MIIVINKITFPTLRVNLQLFAADRDLAIDEYRQIFNPIIITKVL